MCVSSFVKLNFGSDCQGIFHCFIVYYALFPSLRRSWCLKKISYSKHCEIFGLRIFAFVELKFLIMQSKGHIPMPIRCRNPVSETAVRPDRGAAAGDRNVRTLAHRAGLPGAFHRSGHFGLYRRCAGSGRRGFALRGSGGGSHDRHHHPSGLLVHSGRNVLLVSFARSGNSPESLGAIKLADRLEENGSRIFITCNAEGRLARIAAAHRDSLLLVLPAETDDRNSAMTSSFSTMLLTALLVSRIDRIGGHAGGGRMPGERDRPCAGDLRQPDRGGRTAELLALSSDRAR